MVQRVGEVKELLERSFKMLEKVEGHFAAAAYRESSEPPYEPGAAYDDLRRIRYLLADIQNELKKP